LLDQHLDGHPRDKRHAVVVAGYQAPDGSRQHGQPAAVMGAAELEERERVTVSPIGLDQAERVEHLGHGVKRGDCQLRVQRISDDEQVVAVGQGPQRVHDDHQAPVL